MPVFNPHAFSLNFRVLGVEAEEKAAREQLEQDVEQELDALSASELHEPKLT